MSRDFKKFRMATGLTQEDAAKKLSIHPTTLNKYERGARYPSGKVLAEMSRLYNVQMDDLITDPNDLLATTGKQSITTKETDMKHKLIQIEAELLELYREHRMLKDIIEKYEKKEGARNNLITGD